jgi:hypothetical protein
MSAGHHRLPTDQPTPASLRSERPKSRCGGRRTTPADYGPYTTVYNRFNRWSRQGVWSEIICALTGKSDVVTGAVDATYVKAHRSAAGAKGGPSTTPSEPRAAAEPRKSTP